jgi:uncharacterized protein YpbB
MFYLKKIILDCLKQLNGERSVYSIYHLLNGKKSSQTIQDVHLFSLKRYFGLFESLSREEFEEIIHLLLQENLIYLCSDQRYLPTSAGNQLALDTRLPRYFNGWEFKSLESVFWQRLSLLVQVVSNFVYQETHYIPVQKNKEIHLWLKMMIKNLNVTKEEIGPVLFSELRTCLKEAQGINPAVLVFRLTGYGQIGMTSTQTARKLNMHDYDYHLEFIDILHYLIDHINQNSARFCMLSLLGYDLNVNEFLTVSSRKTLELLKRGFSIEEIAGIRNLRPNTIEDHLVELALNIKEFSIEPYVPLDEQKKIIEISQRKGTRQLKIIKNELETVSYFQIRLCIAKNGDKSWN